MLKASVLGSGHVAWGASQKAGWVILAPLSRDLHDFLPWLPSDPGRFTPMSAPLLPGQPAPPPPAPTCTPVSLLSRPGPPPHTHLHTCVPVLPPPAGKPTLRTSAWVSSVLPRLPSVAGFSALPGCSQLSLSLFQPPRSSAPCSSQEPPASSSGPLAPALPNRNLSLHVP